MTSMTPSERVDTLVIGGGQAGLTMSHRLKQRGLYRFRKWFHPGLYRRHGEKVKVALSQLRV